MAKEIKIDVKEGCPYLTILDKLGARFKTDFSCEACMVNPEFCEAYRRGDVKAVNFQRNFLELIDFLIESGEI